MGAALGGVRLAEASLSLFPWGQTFPCPWSSSMGQSPCTAESESEGGCMLAHANTTFDR